MSIATTLNRSRGGQFIAHAKALPGNPYDGRTLATVIPEIETQIGASVASIVADRGYRGHNAPPGHKFRVYISGQRRRLTVRDDRPSGGKDPPAALFYASRDRRGEHPERHLTNWSGILQADAFSGYARLYKPDRKPGPIVEALCWSHARRKFFELADIAANARRGKNAAPISPIALEAVKRIDAIFEIEREINGVTAEERLAARRSRCAPLVAALEEWTRSERAKLSRHNAVAKAIDYMLTRWPAFSRFLEDGRICLTNNAAERALRGLALGRKSWLFAGSERGAERAAIMYTLI